MQMQSLQDPLLTRLEHHHKHLRRIFKMVALKPLQGNIIGLVLSFLIGPDGRSS
jgi:hypothetical protein